MNEKLAKLLKPCVMLIIFIITFMLFVISWATKDDYVFCGFCAVITLVFFALGEIIDAIDELKRK